MLFLLYGFRGLFDHLKSPGHFIPHICKICAEQRPFGVNDDVCRDFRRKAAEPHRLAKAALHAVALYRSPQHSPYGKANAKAFRPVAVAVPQIKHGQVRCKMAASLLVNPLKISMPQQPPFLGKLTLRFLRSAQSRL